MLNDRPTGMSMLFNHSQWSRLMGPNNSVEMFRLDLLRSCQILSNYVSETRGKHVRFFLIFFIIWSICRRAVCHASCLSSGVLIVETV